MLKIRPQIILETRPDGVNLFKRGKVRDVYNAGEHLLIVATDRISAFDVILPTGIPYKGMVLTALSTFWFELIKDIIPSHFVTADIDLIIQNCPSLKSYRSVLAGRSMIVRKTEVIPVECVVRGYLAGSGWKEYRETQSVCGVGLPGGLKESQELTTPIFTPASKEDMAHDINISETEVDRRIGRDLSHAIKSASLAIYTRAREYAKARGIIIADTKFEFGLCNGQVMLIDEILTPDSSRFWPVNGYAPGMAQPSFDKQFVRDYLEGLDWDKTPPGPALPDDIVEKTSSKYLQALELLTGKKLEMRY